MLRSLKPRPYVLPVFSPTEQLRAGRLPRRAAQLLAGLVLAALSMALMIEAHLGLDPWNVLHEGLTKYLPFGFGVITIFVGAVLLLLWLPLHQPVGVGTVANVVLVGLLADLALWAIPTPNALMVRVSFLLAGVVVGGAAAAMILGSHLGAGPRDGVMAGLVARTGRSLRLVRTSLEASVLLIGFSLGGTVGIGTVVFAVAIGPLIQIFLPRVAVRLELEDNAHELVSQTPRRR